MDHHELTTFLNAQLDELEQETLPPGEPIQTSDQEYILADIAAKRRLVEDYRITVGATRHVAGENVNAPGLDVMYARRDTLGYAVKLAASPFAGRSGYREEWKP